MKGWTRALVIAGIVEIPILIGFLTISPGNPERSTLGHMLAWYHVVPAYAMAFVFLWWNPGPETVATRIVFVAGIFIIQAIVTSPIVFLILSLFGAKSPAPRSMSSK